MAYDDYKLLLKNKLSDYRYLHCLNVSNEASILARKYGADVEKAKVAGLLHDITKELSDNEQLKIIYDGGIILTEVEKNSPKLWHAISGMVYLRDNLGINDADILNAVRYHTTARKHMSVLEKVIFLADFTSADRKYEDVDVIREKSKNSLEDGMMYGLKFTINRIVSCEGLLCPDAIDAYNEIIINR